MRLLVRYAVLVIIAAVILTALILTVHAPLLYSLEQDIFQSQYHDNTDVLKNQAINSTTDLLPLMQDLLDYTGPIAVNINMNNMDQVKRDLENYAKYNKNLNNLVVKLDMSQSEIDEFSKSSEKQRQLLTELMNSSISLEELKTLEVQYRDQNNPDMLVSVTIQQETIRKKIRELSEEYKNETKITQAIGKKNNLDTSKEEESVKEIERFAGAQKTESPLPQSPKFTLLIIPDTGQYLDTVDFSGLYYDGNTVRNNYPVVVSVDNRVVAQITTGKDGIYHSAFRIEQISAGQHTVSASSGALTSGIRTLNIKPVNSATSLTITRIKDKPEIQCTGNVIANKPVRNAPVALLIDGRDTLSVTTKNDGTFQTRIRLSPGIHRVQAQFVNASYPISSSKSRIYEIEAGSDAITSIRLLDTAMSVDDISLTVNPTKGTYRDIINLTGILTGTDPKLKNIDIFIDDALYRTVRTGNDGTFALPYLVEKTRTGNHSVFIRYSEQKAGEINSETRTFIINPVNSVTILNTEITNNGTGLTCYGNVTANAHGVSTAPVELVWDDHNRISLRTDATGSFRQDVTLTPGNHRIYARFSNEDYPVKPSQSRIQSVTIVSAPQELSLEIGPASVIYNDQLTIKGTLTSSRLRNGRIDIFLDNKSVTTTNTDSTGKYTCQVEIGQITAGQHTVQARSEALSSEIRLFQVQMANSRTTITINNVSNSALFECTGSVMAFDRSDVMAKNPVQNAPVVLLIDGLNNQSLITKSDGTFQTRIRLSPGMHRIQAQFMNASYPLFSSKSQVYEVEAGSDSISGFRKPDTTMSVDNISLSVIPTRGTYRDIIKITGRLNGTDPKQKKIDVFVDNALYRTMQTGADGTFATPYLIGKTKTGNHTVFIRYSEQKAGEINSESRTFIVNPVNSVTLLTIEITDNGTGLTCYGNVTANAHGVSTAPVELIWDDHNQVSLRTDAMGSFRQKVMLPPGNHRIYARFDGEDYPVKPSQSRIYSFKIIPPPQELSLEVKPTSVVYKDQLTIQGTLINANTSEGKVSIYLDNKSIATTNTDRTGRYTYRMAIGQTTAGQHTVQARSEALSSEIRPVQVLMVNSRTTMTIDKVSNSSTVTCNGSVMAFSGSGSTIRKPGSIPEVLEIIATLGRNPLDTALRPVSLAPVSVIVNNRTLFESQTDATGKFSTQVTLPQGDCTVTARFMNASFPVLASESGGVAISRIATTISPAPVNRISLAGILVPAIAVLMVILFSGGSYLYIKRRSIFVRHGQTPVDRAPEQDTGISSDSSPLIAKDAESFLATISLPEEELTSTDPILSRYKRILHAQGLSTAAREVYLHFTGQIAEKLQIRRHRALTPREFLRSCNKGPFDSAFAPFIAIYEEVRYGGAKSKVKEDEFGETVTTTEKSLGDDDH